eukprot:CAMPEP_0114407518 /NCGR_PEP_ID=MMETSP0102-20121206/21991_1 /TAXON_ID=38822 ORGANISM="Pteridomonas danica, Strain PT" /NCGR_SAMPLE_ID=MMETSP0102 /ASSEMBLY_ACC=CAM_ASM_000212 /LENGTH=160 /DNA_ID=CAMNT_0001574003 /DNA_START=76 /DNA_END=555 /DNA_ORIENTATION=-
MAKAMQSEAQFFPEASKADPAPPMHPLLPEASKADPAPPMHPLQHGQISTVCGQRPLQPLVCELLPGKLWEPFDEHGLVIVAIDSAPLNADSDLKLPHMPTAIMDGRVVQHGKSDPHWQALDAKSKQSMRAAARPKIIPLKPCMRIESMALNERWLERPC